MASGVRLLLRLPPAIRQHVFSKETSGLATPSCCKPLNMHQPKRAFGITSALSKNKQNVFKNVRPQKPTPQAHNLPKPTPKPGKFGPGSSPQAPDILATSPAHARRRAPRPHSIDWISAQFPNSERVLLYVAPNHGAFFAFSYFCGIMFMIGGYTYAQTFLKDDEGQPKTPWYIKLLATGPTLFIVVLGTTFLIAPMKVIKSVALVKEAGANTLSQTSRLRIEVRRLMPFAKPDVLDTTPKQVFLDRNVRMSVQDLRFMNYQIQDHEWFTERYFSGKPLVKKEGNPFMRFNRSLLTAWPSFKKNVRRIFLRDQMAYLRVEGNGNFKLDLQNSHLLDGGKVLEKATIRDDGSRPSLARWIKNLVG